MEYRVRVPVSGYLVVTVEASSPERAMAEAYEAFAIGDYAGCDSIELNHAGDDPDVEEAK